MVWRAGDFAHELLAKVWSATRFIEHPWWENGALLDVLGYQLPDALAPGLRRRLRRLVAPRAFALSQPSRFMEGTQFLPLEWNSVYLDRAEAPRIVHCVGVPVEQRARDMRAALGG